MRWFDVAAALYHGAFALIFGYNVSHVMEVKSGEESFVRCSGMVSGWRNNGRGIWTMVTVRVSILNWNV